MSYGTISYQLLRSAKRIRGVVVRVLGVPDYEGYLGHMQAKHPDAAPLSRDEFARRRLTERYSKPGARCC